MKINEKTKTIDKLIWDINKHLNKFTKGKLKENDLTIPRFFVLWHITKNQPVNMGYLHEKMYMACSTLTVIVDKLVDAGLVKRYRSPEDRRVVLLELSEDGNKLLQKMLYIRQNFLEKAMKDLSIDEQKKIITLLRPIFNNLKESIYTGDDNDE